MHTGYAVYEKTKSAGISSRISEEMNILENLIKVLGKYRADETGISGLIDQLNQIKATYDGFDEVKSYNPDSDQIINLTNDHLDQLGKLINALRDKFIA
jgi:ABC-type transporter Mla subunit MlaD